LSYGVSFSASDIKLSLLPDVWRLRPKNSPAARSALKRESGGESS
jgi:hypothetical protein